MTKTKFSVGDKIVSPKRNVYTISKIAVGKYFFHESDGIRDSASISWVEDYCKLYSVKKGKNSDRHKVPT